MNEEYISTGRTKQKQKTRTVILNTAQKLLAKGSPFSLEDVANEAQISRATIYRYFSSVDILSAEAAIDLNTKSPSALSESVSHLDMQEMMLGIQDYFNQLTVNNESAFRKYLSIVLASPPSQGKRGARRSKTLKMALTPNKTNLEGRQLQKLINIATVLMGVEPLIVTKDVCGLSTKDSIATLQWGLEMILKGMGEIKA